MRGWAEGFGAARHDGRPNSTNYLLALLYGGRLSGGWWERIIEGFDVTAEALIGRLRNLGLELPLTKLPEGAIDPDVVEFPARSGRS